jgi:nucleoside-diphosphate-sugar epimerase
VSRYTVIGAGGFIGGRVVAALRAEGADVHASARDGADLWGQNLGRVFYCAGLTGDYRHRPFAAVEAHVSLLARVLEQARFERLVYLSSTRLYDALDDGDGREDRPIPLDAADPRHIYELSKALGENLAVTQSQGRGVAARLSYVFDWREPAEGFLSDWLRAAASNRSINLDSSPANARDYIHVDDVVRALRAILDNPAAAGVINVARGETLSNAQIAEVFERRGWTVDFRQDATPVPERRCDVRRMAALGVRARDVVGLIDGYLDGLTA